MAEKRRIIRIVGPPTTRVRYGRATLTIAQTGGLVMGEVGNAVAAYEAGEQAAEDLCEHFVRVRVTEHSSTFSWEEADPARVLKLVVEASEEPRFESADPEHVATRLATAVAQEREALQNTAKQLRGTLRATYPKVMDIAGITGAPWFKDSLERLHEAGHLGKTLGLDRIAPRLDAMRGLRGIAGFDDKTVRALRGIPGLDDKMLRGFRGIAGFDENELGRISGVAGIRAIDPKLFETASWVRGLPDPVPWLRKFQEQIGPHLETFNLALPANWRDLTAEEMRETIDLMKADGLSLAWAPRPAILRQLITAEGHKKCGEILVAHREEIVEDVEKVLGEIERRDLESIVAAGLEAIKTYRDGHPAPAQTYAAAVIGEVIHGPLGYETFGDVKREFSDKDPLHDVGYRNFPLFAVGGALARTLDRFKDAGDGFNRNLTQHRIGAPHSEANLLMVLLLLAGLLPEVERVLDRHEAREVPEAA